MASAKSELIVGSEYVRDEQGERVTITYSVPVTGGSPASKVILGAEASVVPRWDARHPSRPQLRARRFRSVPHENQPDRMFVVVQFVEPSSSADANQEGNAGLRVSMSTETISEQTTTDIRGVQMRTTHVTSVAGGLGGSSSVRTVTTHRVAIERPTFGLTFERTENLIAFSKAVDFAGKTNSLPWQGKPAKTWLMRISSSQLENGLHRVRHDAVFNPKTWRAEIIPNVNGIVPNDASLENGIAFYDVYEGIDYNQIGLPRVL